ncbi:rhodanese-like domain-containing protein [Sphingobacterium olei]|uniref:rhodanese-like domain-containing protein n=1 Tax=Sphingobacterium olei TaxID=2571155 RepID=UPI00374336D4
MRNRKLIVQCQYGDRATIASSHLENQEFIQMYNYAGSFADWKALGKPIVSV